MRAGEVTLTTNECWRRFCSFHVHTAIDVVIEPGCSSYKRKRTTPRRGRFHYKEKILDAAGRALYRTAKLSCGENFGRRLVTLV